MYHVRSSHTGDYCVRTGKIGRNNENCDFYCSILAKIAPNGFPAVLVPFAQLTHINYSQTHGFFPRMSAAVLHHFPHAGLQYKHYSWHSSDSHAQVLEINNY